MEDSGYGSFQDPRLQPQPEVEKSEGQLMYEACVHAGACLAQRMRCKPVYGTEWDELGCDGCGQYDDQICPLQLSGTMRCKRKGDGCR